MALHGKGTVIKGGRHFDATSYTYVAQQAQLAKLGRLKKFLANLPMAASLPRSLNRAVDNYGKALGKSLVLHSEAIALRYLLDAELASQFAGLADSTIKGEKANITTLRKDLAATYSVHQVRIVLVERDNDIQACFVRQREFLPMLAELRTAKQSAAFNMTVVEREAKPLSTRVRTALNQPGVNDTKELAAIRAMVLFQPLKGRTAEVARKEEKLVLSKPESDLVLALMAQRWTDTSKALAFCRGAMVKGTILAAAIDAVATGDNARKSIIAGALDARPDSSLAQQILSFYDYTDFEVA